MNELIFIVEEAPEGGFMARALGLSIFTEADSLEELSGKVRSVATSRREQLSKWYAFIMSVRNYCRMRLPRDVSGHERAQTLQVLGYRVTR